MKYGNIIKILVISLFFISSSAIAGTDYNEEDIIDLMSEDWSMVENQNSIKNKRLSKKYKNKTFSITSEVSGYFNSSDINNNYSILWVKSVDGIKIGCLAKSNDIKFDKFSTGQTVIMEGKIHHTDTSRKQLVLTRSCSVIAK